jgi:hypothetical protein
VKKRTDMTKLEKAAAEYREAWRWAEQCREAVDKAEEGIEDAERRASEARRVHNAASEKHTTARRALLEAARE